MKILRMIASFGKLHETLELHDGMNVLELPNEAGKSTWCAFICAMFYGIDTSERKGKQNQLPAKLRYLPWDGAPMEGSMDIEHNGRRITLERTSSVRAPMSIFRAYDTQTGSPIPELTAENCGRILLGVERSVFERTAFVRQTGLAITHDASLEQRLHALVTTGDDSLAYSTVHQQLHKLQNECAGARGGQISKIHTRMAEIDDQLNQISTIRREIRQNTEQIQQFNQQLQTQNGYLSALQKAEQAENARAVLQAKHEAEQAQLLVQTLQQRCEKLPSETELLAMQTKMQQQSKIPLAFQGLSTQQAMERAVEDSAPTTILPAFEGMTPDEIMECAEQDENAYYECEKIEPPKAPEAFYQMDAEQAKDQANSDFKRYRVLKTVPRKHTIPLVIPALFALLGFGLCYVSIYAGVIVILTAVVAVVGVGFNNRSIIEETHALDIQMMEILSRYHVDTPEEILSLAESFAQEYQTYEEQKKQISNKQAEILAKYGVKSPDAIALQAEACCRQLSYDQRRQKELLAMYGVNSPSEFVTAASAYQAPNLVEQRLLFSQISAFFGPCEDVPTALAGIHEAINLRTGLRAAQDASEAANRHYQQLRHSLGETEIGGFDPDSLPNTTPEVVRETIARLEEQIANLGKRNAQLQGRLEAVCDPAALHEESEHLQERLELLNNYNKVLSLTEAHLERTNQDLQTRFAPRISALANAFFHALTEDRYAKLLLDEDFHLRVTTSNSSTLRVSEALSHGTVDQLYLSVRLAMVQLLLREGIPMVLDDALVNFDDLRAEKAVNLLKNQAKSRQILLFTCHHRESRWL